MLDLSTHQLLRLWSELDDAYYGKNGFGGDTAEIYVYTIQPARPITDSEAPEEMRREAVREEGLKAAKTLYEVLVLFSRMRNCLPVIDGRVLAAWLLEEPLDHRVHITIKTSD